MKNLLFIFLSVLLISSVCSATSITLRWDANTETDLDGYKLYYKIDTPGTPYNGIGATEGNSPINIPLTIAGFDPINPEFTINELNAGSIYFLVLTAYDTAGNESGYSNEVLTFYMTTPVNGFVVNSSNYTAFNVHGKAAAFIDVNIYSNNILIGTAIPDVNGVWSADIDFTGEVEGPINIEAKTNTPTTLLTSNSVSGTLNYSAPNPPVITQSLVVTSVTMTSISLSWEDISQATGYVVNRDGTEIDRTTNNQYTDLGLSPKTTYEYEVSTVDNVNIKSNLESATTLEDTPPNGDGDGDEGGGSGSGGCFINSIK